MIMGEFGVRHTVGVHCILGLLLVRVVKALYQYVHCGSSLAVVAAQFSVVEEIVIGENPIAPVANRAKSAFVGERSHDGREVCEITFLDCFLLWRRKLTRACHSQTLASHRCHWEENYLHTASSDSTRVLT